MPPLPNSERVIELYNGKGCLVRMLFSVENELEALRMNEEGGFMVRPSSLVQNDIPTPPLYHGGRGWGVFIDSSISIGGYKGMTLSNNLPRIISAYQAKTNEEQQAEGSLHDFVIKELNKDDGERRGKTALRNLAISELKDKLTEMRDRAVGRIADVDTKTHLQRVLEQMTLDQPLTKEIMEDKLQKQDMPDYLKKQILKKYDAYIVLLENKTVNGMLDYVKWHKALKGENWKEYKNILCETMLGFDPVSGRIIHVVKVGQVSLSQEVYPHLKSDSAREMLKAVIVEMYPGELEDKLTYEQLGQAFLSLANKTEERGSRHVPQNPQYTSSEAAEFRGPRTSEIISVPKYEDCLALYFHPDMSEADWEKAEKFRTLMRERGHGLEYFCLLSEEYDNLQGPFSYKEAHEYRPPTRHPCSP